MENVQILLNQSLERPGAETYRGQRETAVSSKISGGEDGAAYMYIPQTSEMSSKI